MQIINFTASHIDEAMDIAKQEYIKAQIQVPSLPPIRNTLSLVPFAKNDMGVAAFCGDKLVGFICAYEPVDNAFGVNGLRHAFSPMGANGVVGDKRAEIYAHMYRAVAEKWAKRDVLSHGISLYSHDKESLAQFFRYGFGIRTVDALRRVDEILVKPTKGYTFSELDSGFILEVLPLENMLNASYIESPFFMYRKPNEKNEFLTEYERINSIYIVARCNGKIVGFIRAEHDGETFIKETKGYIHCKGLYCIKEHRGKGLAKTLLSLLIKKIKEQGYTLLGTDYESFNPSGSSFWSKYFDQYTYGVVRRIDRCE